MKTFNEKFDDRWKIECSAHERTSSAKCICEELPDLNEEYQDIKSFFTSEIQNLFTAMLAECDKTENEDGRFLVEKFRKEFD